MSLSVMYRLQTSLMVGPQLNVGDVVAALIRYLNKNEPTKRGCYCQMQAGGQFERDVDRSGNRKAGVMAEGMHDFTAAHGYPTDSG